MLEMEFESIWKQYEAEKARQTEAAATTGMVAPQIPGQASDGDSAGGTEDAPAIAERPPELSSDPVMAAPAEDVPESAPADPTQADAEEQEARAEYRRIAERRVRLGLLLAEVGRNNNITVTQEELNQALAREARRFPGHERQVLDYYRKNPESMNNLRAPIFEDKVVDFILELATVEERQVTPEELMSFPEPEHAEPEAPAPGPEAAAPAP
ncbi:MAG: hypothetical protein JO267_08660 [Alphaproteobacteria bacterium]|nr:hypothetical protein [Alphaproteobacteria bacterium]